MQFHATASDQDTTAHQQSEDSNHLESARFSDEVRADATTCEKAGDGIRTHDVQLGKLATHIASTSKYSISERGKSNPSTIPSSQAQETRVSEPYLTSIKQALGELPSVERDAVAQHINALATMSKNRRHAILTLTEEET